ncbi:hypothetical protein [[Eubacterium] hominis]|uniref:hypothetical protein n=1 Tax=[Eubacterium] hominis TaxID=2764325 RepID=UPI003A4E411E
MKLQFHNVIKNILYIILFSSILLAITTWIPSLYQSAGRNNDIILQEIQKNYQVIAEELKLDKDSFQDVVTLDNIKQNTSSLDIQKQAVKVISDKAKDSSYDIKDTMIEKLAIEMQQIYDHLMFQVDTTETLQQVRIYSLGTIILSEALILIIDKIKKKKNS